MIHRNICKVRYTQNTVSNITLADVATLNVLYSTDILNTVLLFARLA